MNKVSNSFLIVVLMTGLTFGIHNEIGFESMLCNVQQPKEFTIGTAAQNFEKLEQLKFDKLKKEMLDAEIKRKIKEEKQKEKQHEITSRGNNKVAFKLSDAERRIVECIVMGEARGESYKGKVLVAQCILNACTIDNLQPSQVRKQFKYSGWHENPSEEVKKAVRAVFDDGYRITNEPILYFYAPKSCAGKFHETQNYVISEGSHKFFSRC